MAKISLRAYNHEIENLIDRGQTEEGISHCKYILKTYSKHLDTYRLLGKAFLESQRYSEAADILQRILSVQPDDFVSQIGMSIIREDEGNLDAAIYHMERAFEIQPANVAIQDELRRLYGRRDGVEPSKLRMTRGALVRMYARGDLYRQAIAEARAALKEDPQRLDLEIVLARMYFQTGLKAEAAEISSRLVGKLPYCFEANRILAEVLPETSRAEEAKTYQQKLIALDPYLAYLSGTVIDPRQVPENAVSLDRLDWTPSLESGQQPAWANSLGIQLNETENEQMPNWMITVPSSDIAIQTSTEDQTAAQPFSEEPALFESQVDAISSKDNELEIQSQEDDLPDWMKSSGWGISHQPTQEQVETISESEDLAAEPADIPDWLKQIAPGSDTANIEEETLQHTDWEKSIPPVEFVQANQTEESPQLEPNTEILPELSDTKVSSSIDDELPDWFKTSMPSVDESTFANQSNEPLPDWLSEPAKIPPNEINIEQTPVSFGEVISPVAPEETSLIEMDSKVETLEPGAQVNPLDSQLQSIPLDEVHETGPSLTDTDDAMSWLESLAAKNGADEATLLTRPEERMGTPPEWVSLAADKPSSNTIEPVINMPAEELLSAAAITEVFAAPVEEVSVPIAEVSAPIEEASAPIEEIAIPVAEVSTPMAEIIAPIEEVTVPIEEIAVPIEEDSTSIPEMLIIAAQEIGEPVDFQKIGTVESEIPTPKDEIVEPADQTLTSETIDMDAAFSWLESLAARQGADAESLLSDAGERQETPPDWVQTQAAEAAVIDETASMPDIEEPSEQLPEWMQSTDIIPPSTESVNSEEQALPDWLNNLDSSSEQPYTHSEELPGATQEIPSVGEWIHEQDVDENSIVTQPVEIQSQTNELGTEEVEEDILPTATSGSTRPLPSWLANDTESAQNSSQEVIQPDIAEDLPLPEWLKDDKQPESLQPAASGKFAEENAPELPDWLKNLEAEQQDEPLSVASLSTPLSEQPEIVVSSIPSEMLMQAQEVLAKGQIELSMSIYSQLIQQGQHIEETIHDLRDALYRYPVESEIWQTLGDASFRNNHVQEALDAYTKAEELLK